MLFDAFIYPLMQVMRWLLELLHASVDNWGLSIILLSVVVSIIMIPLQRIANRIRQREQALQDAMAEELAVIKDCYSGIKKNEFLWTLYRQHQYHPIMGLRASIGLLILIPFFFAAYKLLEDFLPLEGVSFLFIPDLSQPDRVLWGVNVMPFIMTAASLLNLWVVSKYGNKQGGWKSLVALTVLFFVLLYNMAAGLVLYWTTNNLIGAFKTYVTRNRPEPEGDFQWLGSRKAGTESWLSKWPLHVVLLPYCAVARLLAVNAKAAYHDLESAVPSLPWWIGPAVLLWLVCWAVTGDKRRAGLIVTLPGVVCLFGGAAVLYALRPFDAVLVYVYGQRLEIWMDLALMGLALVWMLWMLWRWRETQSLGARTYRANSAFLLLSVILTLQCYSGLDQSYARLSGLSQPEHWPKVSLTEEQQEELPNVMILFLDGLPDVLSMDLFDCGDISWFVEALEDRGFVVPDVAYRSHPSTRHIAGGLLNASYLPDLHDWSRPEPPNAVLTHLIHNNEAFRYFSDHGYDTHSKSHGRDFIELGARREGDNSFEGQASEFQTGLLNQSVFHPIARLYRRFVPSYREPLADYYRSCIDEMKTVKEHLRSDQQPLLYLAQVLTGHAPYLFNEDGSLRPGGLYTVNASSVSADEMKVFNDQIQFILRRTLATIDELLQLQEQSERPLVVFLVGDHGLHEVAVTTGLRDAEGRTFAAWYSSDEKLPPSDEFVLPNLFRMVLRGYWPIASDQFPLLPTKALANRTENGRWVFEDRRPFIDEYFEDAARRKSRGESLLVPKE